MANANSEDENGIDSLKQIVNGTAHDTAKLKALRVWSNSIYLSNPDLDLKLNQRMDEICRDNLSKDISEAERKTFLRLRSGAINVIGYYYKSKGQYDKAITYYMESLDISEQLNDQKSISMNVNSLGNLYTDMGDYDKAKFFYLKGLKIDQAIGDDEGMASAYVNIGNVYNKKGQVAKAIEYLLKSLKIQEQIGSVYGMGLCYINIGEVYQQQGDLTSAMENYEQSLQYFDSVAYDFGSASCYNNMANIFQAQGQLKKAVTYHLKALSLREKIKDQMSIANSVANLGKLAMRMDDLKMAEFYLKRSLGISEELEDQVGVAASLSSLGRIKCKQQQYPLAEDYGRRALTIAQQKGSLVEIKSASKLLWNALKAQSQYAEALEMHELYLSMKDSLQGESNQKEVLQKQFQYDLEKQYMADSMAFAQQQAMEAMQHQVELEREENQRYLLYGGIGALAILGMVLFISYRGKTKDNQLISQQKAEVEENKRLLELKNEEIIDSISYAKRIQHAILPPLSVIHKALPDSFIYYLPKDIVAGDFYWMKAIDQSVYIAAADCTGHGVPGAMVSVVCNSGLNRSVREFKLTEPGQILDKTRALVVKEFETSEEEVSDGMDIAMLKINGQHIQYAGAHNPLWLIRGGELQVYKADKQPVGQYPDSKPFNTIDIEGQSGDLLYLFSDGFADQFGGEKGKKYMSARFKRFLLSIHQHPMDTQKQMIHDEFEAWRGQEEQIDDVCVIGIRI